VGPIGPPTTERKTKLKSIICLCVIALSALHVALAKNPPMPDLIVRGDEFKFAGNKTVIVYVSNNGDAPSKRCILELTVRKIGGVAVGRVTKAVIPQIAPGQFVEIRVNATAILPNDVNLKDTTFKVIADSTKRNAESNEGNNEKWHNL
jgi:hypothetical protein